jgi:uncharacterized Zn finger protein (UPF0148 family)
MTETNPLVRAIQSAREERANITAEPTAVKSPTAIDANDPKVAQIAATLLSKAPKADSDDDSDITCPSCGHSWSTDDADAETGEDDPDESGDGDPDELEDDEDFEDRKAHAVQAAVMSERAKHILCNEIRKLGR